MVYFLAFKKTGATVYPLLLTGSGKPYRKQRDSYAVASALPDALLSVVEFSRFVRSNTFSSTSIF